MTAEPTRGWTFMRGLLTALAFIGFAVFLRLPVLLYSVTNFDESLYLLIGDELASGVLPFTGICDRKPFGLFAIFALFAAAPFDAIVASRLGASVSVGLTAFLLHQTAGLLFRDEERGIGRTAGIAYIVFSLANGGTGSNSEVFVSAFAVLGLLLLLRAGRAGERPHRGYVLGAGLVLGLGLQVKPTILFDAAAFAAGFYLLTTPDLKELGKRLRLTLPRLLLGAGAAALPTLAVILLYAVTGHWDAWALANLAAQRGFVDDPAQPIEYDAALRAMAEQAPLWLGTLVAACLARRLVRSWSEGRAVVFLLIWIGMILLLQFFLRIAADHYFLQFLPAFCLLNGFVIGRGLLSRCPSAAARAGVLTALALLAVFGVAKNQLVNTAYVLRDRIVLGEAWAADTPRRVAADLKRVLEPGDAIYQVGFLPIVYHLTGAEIPTRFAFTGLPHRRYAGRDGCPWVPQEVELERILDTRPRFVIVELGAFYKELDPSVRALLDARLDRDYRLRWTYAMHWIHRLYPFERFALNAAGGAMVFELVEPAPVAGSAPPDVQGRDDVVPDDADRDPG